MKVIQTEHKGGKTTALIKECAKHPYALIVCHNHEEAKRVFARARYIGVRIPMPITYDELTRHSYHHTHVQAIYLDNADIFLQSLTSVPIHAITLTNDPLPQPSDAPSNRDVDNGTGF